MYFTPQILELLRRQFLHMRNFDRDRRLPAFAEVNCTKASRTQLANQFNFCIVYFTIFQTTLPTVAQKLVLAAVHEAHHLRSPAERKRHTLFLFSNERGWELAELRFIAAILGTVGMTATTTPFGAVRGLIVKCMFGRYEALTIQSLISNVLLPCSVNTNKQKIKNSTSWGTRGFKDSTSTSFTAQQLRVLFGQTLTSLMW